MGRQQRAGVGVVMGDIHRFGALAQGQREKLGEVENRNPLETLFRLAISACRSSRLNWQSGRRSPAPGHRGASPSR